MSRPIHLAVIGDGRLATELRTHGAPLGRIRLVDAGARDAQAVLVDLPPGERLAAVLAALRGGRIVLCPPPVALDAAALAAIDAAQTRGGGFLLPAGEIAHGPAGSRGLAAMAAPEFGALRSLYLAIRQPRGTGEDVLETLLPEALDMVLAAMPERFTSVRVNSAALFGAARDTAVILLRSETDVVVTIELSRCLPPGLPAPGLGEVEIDAMGARQSVRIVPHASAVRIHRDDGVAVAPWQDSPALAMLRAVVARFDAPLGAASGLLRATRALTLTEAISAARASGYAPGYAIVTS